MVGVDQNFSKTWFEADPSCSATEMKKMMMANVKGSAAWLPTRVLQKSGTPSTKERSFTAVYRPIQPILPSKTLGRAELSFLGKSAKKGKALFLSAHRDEIRSVREPLKQLRFLLSHVLRTIASPASIGLPVRVRSSAYVRCVSTTTLRASAGGPNKRMTAVTTGSAIVAASVGTAV